MTTIAELGPSQLRPFCNPSRFDFHSTADFSKLTGVIGQKRAVRALPAMSEHWKELTPENEEKPTG